MLFTIFRVQIKGRNWLRRTKIVMKISHCKTTAFPSHEAVSCLHLVSSQICHHSHLSGNHIQVGEDCNRSRTINFCQKPGGLEQNTGVLILEPQIKKEIRYLLRWSVSVMVASNSAGQDKLEKRKENLEPWCDTPTPGFNFFCGFRSSSIQGIVFKSG
jgi:hypothetical protein